MACLRSVNHGWITEGTKLLLCFSPKITESFHSCVISNYPPLPLGVPRETCNYRGNKYFFRSIRWLLLNPLISFHNFWRALIPVYWTCAFSALYTNLLLQKLLTRKMKAGKRLSNIPIIYFNFSKFKMQMHFCEDCQTASHESCSRKIHFSLTLKGRMSGKVLQHVTTLLHYFMS